MSKDIKQLFQKIEQAKEKFVQLDAQLSKQRIEASTGAGMVRVIVNGKQEIVEIHIDPEIIREKDKELLEDLIKTAVNEARKKAIKVSQELLKKEALSFNFWGDKDG
jgi:hypothetical protein